MKKNLKWLLGAILVLLIVYFAGPKPAKPDFTVHEFSLPDSLPALEKKINQDEKRVKNIKPDNQARIVWADSSKKEKTKLAFLYLHGFPASWAEGYPVNIDLAKKYHANLYLSRLAEHGIERGDSTMIDLTADKWEASAEEALAITKKLGDEVIIIGTSGGAALTLFLTSRHPEIKAIVLYSPCIRLYDKAGAILIKPWGLQLARLIKGSPVVKDVSTSETHARYWDLHYRLEGVQALVNLYSNALNREVFGQIKCPVFMGYYYKNEEEQDKVVSVPAMLKMFDELGTPSGLKQKEAFPNAGAHVISSSYRSKDWQGVEKETEKFLSDIVKL